MHQHYQEIRYIIFSKKNGNLNLKLNNYKKQKFVSLQDTL